jgi:hypothetical protein
MTGAGFMQSGIRGLPQAEAARTLADRMTGGIDWTAAAILVAMHDDPTVDILPGDDFYVGELETLGCLAGGAVAPFGRLVAACLRSDGRVLPFPGAHA